MLPFITNGKLQLLMGVVQVQISAKISEEQSSRNPLPALWPDNNLVQINAHSLWLLIFCRSWLGNDGILLFTEQDLAFSGASGSKIGLLISLTFIMKYSKYSRDQINKHNRASNRLSTFFSCKSVQFIAGIKTSQDYVLVFCDILWFSLPPLKSPGLIFSFLGKGCTEIGSWILYQGWHIMVQAYCLIWVNGCSHFPCICTLNGVWESCYIFKSRMVPFVRTLSCDVYSISCCPEYQKKLLIFLAEPICHPYRISPKNIWM